MPDDGAFDPAAPLRLSDSVALRDEPFGALAYHYGTRRLVFLKSRGLVEVLRELDRFACARDAVDALVPPAERGRYLAAIGRLYDQGVLGAA